MMQRSFASGFFLAFPVFLLTFQVTDSARAAAAEGGNSVAPSHQLTEKSKALSEAVWSPAKCDVMTGDDPYGARDYAQDWLKHNGGRPALHCFALAQMSVGEEVAAAKILNDLARNGPFSGPDSSDGQRAVIASEAAQAWLAASQPSEAVTIADYGLSLQGADMTLMLLRARAQLMMGHFDVVARDLGALVARTPQVSAEIYMLLASAERRDGLLPQAQLHIARAAEIAPQDSAVLLERGIIRGQTGDFSGARSDWQQVIELAPDTHDADLARQDLAVQAADPDMP
ncbi:lipopolysaccharide assembly protein LapB [Acetobacter sp. DmW_043]|uniref:tetratricopeptide repeat protein n=1 Tax=Acetobacter sp. DmW_043 TaxID=1670658 RepID=UPI001E52682E|nr:hypothetical protein [Acetobacter sp. DmW_043]